MEQNATNMRPPCALELWAVSGCGKDRARAGGGVSRERWLLEDIASATRAYARVCGATYPQAMLRDARADTGPSEHTELYPGTADSKAGAALVLALDAGLLQNPTDIKEMFAKDLTAVGAPERSINVYAVVLDDSYDTPSTDTEEIFGALCDETRTRWSGGMVVAAAAALPHLFRSPRMGLWRRQMSEATDRLVAAIRMGATLTEAAWLMTGEPGPSMLITRPAIPKFVYRHIGKTLKVVDIAAE